jgi:glycosyltransferase involved in cell wall biosynthesis
MKEPLEHEFRVVSGANLGEPSRHILMTLDAVGGVWRYAMDLASQMRPMGFRFTFAGLGPPPDAAQREEAKRLGRLLWLEAPLDWLVEDERALDAIPPQLAALVAAERVDLVHLNLPSQAAGLVLDVPVVVVSHSCVVTWFRAVRGTVVPAEWAWQQRRNRSGFDNAALVLSPSHSHASLLQSSYGPIPNLRVVYNGSRPSPGSATKDPFILAAGRWWDDGKNAALLDSAAPSVDWPVVLVGHNRGPAGQYTSLSHVDHRGQCPHGEVRALMARAAIICSPSVYEPFGLAPLEAAAAGSALVLADNPTYRELWDGTALFAAPDDPSALADALNRLCRDFDLRMELGQRARVRARRFSVEAQARAMNDVYLSALAQSSNARSA